MIRHFWRRAICAAASGGALWFLRSACSGTNPGHRSTGNRQADRADHGTAHQLETAKNQLTQLQSLHGSLNKLTNMGDIAALLSNPAVRQALAERFRPARSRA